MSFNFIFGGGSRVVLKINRKSGRLPSAPALLPVSAKASGCHGPIPLCLDTPLPECPAGMYRGERHSTTSGGSGQHRAPAGLFPPVGRDQAPVRPGAKTTIMDAGIFFTAAKRRTYVKALRDARASPLSLWERGMGVRLRAQRASVAPRARFCWKGCALLCRGVARYASTCRARGNPLGLPHQN